MFNDNNNQPDVRHASPWTILEDKLFELALVKFPEGVFDRWQMIANEIQGGGRTAEEVKTHYDELVRDLDDIESGRIPLPDYPNDYYLDMEEPFPLVMKHTNQPSSMKDKTAKNEGRKGKGWTEDEHRLFLHGLEKYGKGDWRSISRNIMKTKTATQVASHAQKYFMRQSHDGAKKRKRSSIHDITDPADAKFVTPLNTFPPPIPIQQQGYQNNTFPLPIQQEGYQNNTFPPNHQQGYQNNTFPPNHQNNTFLPNHQQGYQNNTFPSNHQQGYQNFYHSPPPQM